MRILALSNPHSGTSSRRRRSMAFLERLSAGGDAVTVEAPESEAMMRARAARVSRSDHEVLLVAGGDGTLHSAVNGLVRVPREDRPALAVLPVGRGNDFAAEIGISSEEDAFRAIRSRRSRRVDIGRTEAGVFLGIAGTGFDARAARRARETPVLSGSLLYTYAVFRTLADFRPLNARVRYEGGGYEGAITFAAIGNTRRYGGGMRITPRADLEDGLLDLCIVRPISRSTLLRMLPKVFSGAHLSHPSVLYVKTRFVEIETEEVSEVFADGEPLQPTPTRADVLPLELEVLVPPETGRESADLRPEAG
jgi:diacylglycerol kinase (ATP)